MQGDAVIKPQFILFALFLFVVAVLGTTQWGGWRTGRAVFTPLVLISGGPKIAPPGRIWIDTDAACGNTDRTDPDDCLAILWLVSQDAGIAGLSTSFGNATGDVVADRIAALMAQITLGGMSAPLVFRGYDARPASGAPQPPGVAALQAALNAGPLTILALGPLTNVAAALSGRPDLQRNVTRIVAVMGHRPGHLFHPTEGKGTGALFGHGPIFRDLNVSVDPQATRAVLTMHLPMALIPYDAARATLITGGDLESLARQSQPHRWVVETARPWLAFWNEDVGLPGFYPFDWIAAAYLTDPSLFNCAAVSVRMTREWTFWIVPHESLVVDPPGGTGDPAVVLYCPESSELLHETLIAG